MTRINMLEIEEKRVNPNYGTLSSATLGRKRKDMSPDIRSDFQRDRDRIIYSDAFYRLGGKTQVFMSPRNPLISNRMTHTLQVAQIARTIARAIGLNEDLAEAIGLGHDVGHPPFGHRGEMVLDRLTKKYLTMGFKHHIQSVIMLERVERGGRGLNLTYEVKDGIICHSGEARGGEIWVSESPLDIDSVMDTGIMEERQPYTLEGAVVKLCDKIAYVGKDIEDAIRSGLITRDDIPEDIASILGRTNGQIIDTLVRDIINNFMHDLDVFIDKHHREPKRTEIPIRMSKEKASALDSLIFDFNYKNIYLNPENIKYADQTEGIIEEVFERYLKELMSLKKISKDIPLLGWNFSEIMPKDVFDYTIEEIESALNILQPGKWTKLEYRGTALSIAEKIGPKRAIEFLKELRYLILMDHIKSFHRGSSSIIFFLENMGEEYLRETPIAAMVRDSIVSMTDTIALSTFEAMRIPKPIV